MGGGRLLQNQVDRRADRTRCAARYARNGESHRPRHRQRRPHRFPRTGPHGPARLVPRPQPRLRVCEGRLRLHRPRADSARGTERGGEGAASQHRRAPLPHHGRRHLSRQRAPRRACAGARAGAECAGARAGFDARSGLRREDFLDLGRHPARVVSAGKFRDVRRDLGAAGERRTPRGQGHRPGVFHRQGRLCARHVGAPRQGRDLERRPARRAGCRRPRAARGARRAPPRHLAPRRSSAECFRREERALRDAARISAGGGVALPARPSGARHG